MARRRKTQREKEDEWRNAQQRVWASFEPKLAALSSFDDAIRLVGEGVPPDTPGRKYYSNLGFFLGDFTAPAGGNLVEYGYYLQFVRRLDAAGKLKKGALAEIESKFREKMKGRL